MQIHVNTDDNTEGREKLTAHRRNVLENTLSRFNSWGGCRNAVMEAEAHTPWKGS